MLLVPRVKQGKQGSYKSQLHHHNDCKEHHNCSCNTIYCLTPNNDLAVDCNYNDILYTGEGSLQTDSQTTTAVRHTTMLTACLYV